MRNISGVRSQSTGDLRILGSDSSDDAGSVRSGGSTSSTKSLSNLLRSRSMENLSGGNVKGAKASKISKELQKKCEDVRKKYQKAVAKESKTPISSKQAVKHPSSRELGEKLETMGVQTLAANALLLYPALAQGIDVNSLIQDTPLCFFGTFPITEGHQTKDTAKIVKQIEQEGKRVTESVAKAFECFNKSYTEKNTAKVKDLNKRAATHLQEAKVRYNKIVDLALRTGILREGKLEELTEERILLLQESLPTSNIPTRQEMVNDGNTYPLSQSLAKAIKKGKSSNPVLAELYSKVVSLEKTGEKIKKLEKEISKLQEKKGKEKETSTKREELNALVVFHCREKICIESIFEITQKEVPREETTRPTFTVPVTTKSVSEVSSPVKIVTMEDVKNIIPEGALDATRGTLLTQYATNLPFFDFDNSAPTMDTRTFCGEYMSVENGAYTTPSKLWDSFAPHILNREDFGLYQKKQNPKRAIEQEGYKYANLIYSDIAREPQTMVHDAQGMASPGSNIILLKNNVPIVATSAPAFPMLQAIVDDDILHERGKNGLVVVSLLEETDYKRVENRMKNTQMEGQVYWKGGDGTILSKDEMANNIAKGVGLQEEKVEFLQHSIKDHQGISSKESIESYKNLLKEINQKAEQEGKLVVVHCNAGVGRTGLTTILAEVESVFRGVNTTSSDRLSSGRAVLSQSEAEQLMALPLVLAVQQRLQSSTAHPQSHDQILSLMSVARSLFDDYFVVDSRSVKRFESSHTTETMPNVPRVARKPKKISDYGKSGSSKKHIAKERRPQTEARATSVIYENLGMELKESIYDVADEEEGSQKGYPSQAESTEGATGGVWDRDSFRRYDTSGFRTYDDAFSSKILGTGGADSEDEDDLFNEPPTAPMPSIPSYQQSSYSTSIPESTPSTTSRWGTRDVEEVSGDSTFGVFTRRPEGRDTDTSTPSTTSRWGTREPRVQRAGVSLPSIPDQPVLPKKPLPVLPKKPLPILPKKPSPKPVEETTPTAEVMDTSQLTIAQRKALLEGKGLPKK